MSAATTRAKEEVTPVLFRVWKPAEGRGVFALFPTIPANEKGHHVFAYEDHMPDGALLAGCVQRSRPAEPSEYREMKRELEAKFGYKLKVYDRTPSHAHEKFMAALRASRGSGAGKGGGGAKSSAGRGHIRFFIDIAKSSRGERGWQLAEWVDGAPHFRFWSKSSIAVRREAHRLGGTDEDTLIEGVRPDVYIMPEGSGYTMKAR